MHSMSTPIPCHMVGPTHLAGCAWAQYSNDLTLNAAHPCHDHPPPATWWAQTLPARCGCEHTAA
eukprot:scaffold119013_cov27-Tisochrysis_lutea.AAC.1